MHLASVTEGSEVQQKWCNSILGQIVKQGAVTSKAAIQQNQPKQWSELKLEAYILQELRKQEFVWQMELQRKLLYCLCSEPIELWEPFVMYLFICKTKKFVSR